MSATDELVALLKERGVEHTAQGSRLTTYRCANGAYAHVSEEHGWELGFENVLHIEHKGLIPTQAIDAMLGRTDTSELVAYAHILEGLLHSTWGYPIEALREYIAPHWVDVLIDMTI